MNFRIGQKYRVRGSFKDDPSTPSPGSTIEITKVEKGKINYKVLEGEPAKTSTYFYHDSQLAENLTRLIE